MIPDALLAFLYALVLALVGVFAYSLCELVRGWRTRGRRPYVWVGGHRWEVELLNEKITWYHCTRCHGIGLSHEHGH